MKSFFIISALILASLLSGFAADSPSLPEYPKQRHINAALRQLADAQKKVGGNNADAIIHLKKACLALEASVNNKGSFRATALRLTNQAVKHLEDGDKATATKEIGDAMEAVHKAGKAAAR